MRYVGSGVEDTDEIHPLGFLRKVTKAFQNTSLKPNSVCHNYSSYISICFFKKTL